MSLVKTFYGPGPASPTDLIDNRQRQILTYLAKNGPKNKYRIRKESVAGSQPMVLAAVDDLKRMGFIRVAERTETKIPRLTSLHYDLTNRGIVVLLSTLTPEDDGDKPVKVSDLAKKYPASLPGVFDIWPSTIKAGIQELAEKRVLEFCSGYSPDIAKGLTARSEKAMADIQTQAREFFWQALPFDYPAEARERWIEGLFSIIRANKSLFPQIERRIFNNIVCDVLTNLKVANQNLSLITKRASFKLEKSDTFRRLEEELESLRSLIHNIAS